MTEEEYSRQSDEQESLISRYNALLERRGNLVTENYTLAEELNVLAENAEELVSYAHVVDRTVRDMVSDADVKFEDLAELYESLQSEVEQLSEKYFVIKNISSASKTLTQLTRTYEREFGMYGTLRRVTLGYVVGMDESIIQNEELRASVEDNYLRNTDYWLSHCIRATMLWVSDTQSGSNRADAERAVERAMKLDARKSALYFLLVNLGFGRRAAADHWLKYYLRDVDVTNAGEDIRVLLQVYLHNICGTGDVCREEVHKLLNDVRMMPDFDESVHAQVREFISEHVHKTAASFVELQNTCPDYQAMLEMLEKAEKNRAFAEYFRELCEADDSKPAELALRVRNVLYDLISTYDEAELDLMRSIDYYEMILKARGDLAVAQRAFDIKYPVTQPRSLGHMLIKLAFPSSVEVVDVRVRKFAVSFMRESIKQAFQAYRQQYCQLLTDTHEVTIDSYTIRIKESEGAKATQELKGAYKQDRHRIISRDKNVRTLFWLAFVGWLGLAGTLISGGIQFFMQNTVGVMSISLVAGAAVISLGLTIWWLMQRRWVGRYVTDCMNRSLHTLNEVLKEMAKWRESYKAADGAYGVLMKTLDQFTQSEEA